MIAISGFVVTGPGGSLTDRYGARAVLLGGLTAMIVGNVLLAFATSPGVAALAMVLIGINFGVSWPAFNVLIANVVSGDLRQKYFGVNFALINLGIGVGGILGGLYVDVRATHVHRGVPRRCRELHWSRVAAAGPAAKVHGRAERRTTPPSAATGRSSASLRCAG